MSEPANKVLLAAAVRVLIPLVRILLRNGVAYGALADLLKWVYVHVASQDCRIPHKKLSVSRIAVVTGLPRKEVTKLASEPRPEDGKAQAQYNRAARVVSGWVRDTVFSGPDGQPADLPLEGGGASFTALVHCYAGDVPVKAVLDELTRVDAALMLKDGRVRLAAREYVPNRGEEEKIAILGTDVADLIRTIDHNIKVPPEESRLQLKVSYDNLPLDVLPRLRWLGKERARALLGEMDRWLAGHDRDVNPAATGHGRVRAGLGIYYFEEVQHEAGPNA